jgi:hypothetical protein
METEELILKLQTMTIQEKLALLSDTDKAYLTGYIDRAAIDIKPHLRTPFRKNNANGAKPSTQNTKNKV